MAKSVKEVLEMAKGVQVVYLRFTDLPENARLGIPNDPSNQTRALVVLRGTVQVNGMSSHDARLNRADLIAVEWLPAAQQGADGIDLAAEITGALDAMPVLLAHGGGQTRRAWKRVTGDLACRFPLRFDPGFSSRSDPGGCYVPRCGQLVKPVFFPFWFWWQRSWP